MSNISLILRRIIMGIMTAIFAAGTFLLLTLCVLAQAQPSGDAGVSTARGTVQRFTTAPRGEVDGAVLDDGTWLHWPPHMQDRFTGILKEGDRVRATGRPETGPAGDPHFEVPHLPHPPPQHHA